MAMMSTHFAYHPSHHRRRCRTSQLRPCNLAGPIFSSTAPAQPPRFLAPDDAAKLSLLNSFNYSGSLAVGLMGADLIDPTAWLLAESFAESMLVPKQYVGFLAFLVKQYVVEKRAMLPFAATLVGVCRGDEEKEEELVGTAEISFDRRESNASPPTLVPPPDLPYNYNMAVKQELRSDSGCDIFEGED